MSNSDAATGLGELVSKNIGASKESNKEPLTPHSSQPQPENLHTSRHLKSHGTITFPIVDKEQKQARFVCIDEKTHPSLVTKFFYEDWFKDERPSFVISITGGATDFKLKSRLSRLLRRALQKVARTTGAWIITGGTDKGIMKMVGDLVQDNRGPSYPIRLIGIATWGCISDREKLKHLESIVHYSKPSLEAENEAPLEPNHTEFILVDDGSVNDYGREIEFRAQLEKEILENFPKPESSSLVEGEDGVPVVLLVVGGGPNSVETVYKAVTQNKIPAVFLEGTGRCCDLFGEACRLYKKHLAELHLDEEPSRSASETDTTSFEQLKTQLRDQLKDQLNALIVKSEPSRSSTTVVENRNTTRVYLEKYFDMVYKCLRTQLHLLTIVSLNYQRLVEPDIDLAILNALLSATPNSTSREEKYLRKHRQLKLALEWNRSDTVRKSIMTTGSDWQRVNLEGMFESALRQDKTEFVELFLDHDFSLLDTFQISTLYSLYKDVCKDNVGLPDSPSDRLRTIYQTILQPLIGKSFDFEIAAGLKEPTKTSSKYDDKDEEFCVCCMSSGTTQPTKSPAKSQPVSPKHQMDVDKELFLWSIFAGKCHFARLFWGRSNNKICAALVAVGMCKKLAQKKNDSPYSKIAHDFEDLAVQTLDRYYRTNARHCKRDMNRKISPYGDVTWFRMAIEGEAKTVMAHQAAQEVLDDIWHGDTNQHMSPWNSVLSVFVPGWYLLLAYRNERKETNKQLATDGKLANLPFPPQSNAQNSSKASTYKKGNNGYMSVLSSSTSDNERHAGPGDPTQSTKIGSSISRQYNHFHRFMRAPIVKYISNIYYQLCFLTLFSVVMLREFFPLYPVDTSVCPFLSSPDKELQDNDHLSRTNGTVHLNKTVPPGFETRDHASTLEWILFFWVFTLLCDELRQFVNIDAKTLPDRFGTYFEDRWNILDIVAIILFYVGFTLRFFPPTGCFCAARIILSVDLTLWFVRLLEMFKAFKLLGPKLVMIREMSKDFAHFLYLLTVFLLGFGVSIYSILYGSKATSYHTLRKIFNVVFWEMFGELKTLETFQHDYTPNGYAAFILLVVYMLIVSILLVNLLIAIFNYKFDQLKNDTARIWKVQRYPLVFEYLTRPSLPPPLIILSHISHIASFSSTMRKKFPVLEKIYQHYTDGDDYKRMLDKESESVLETAEDEAGDKVFFNSMKTSRKGDELVYNQNENRLQSTQEIVLSKVQSLENQMQTMTNQQNQVMTDLSRIMTELKRKGGNRVSLHEEDLLKKSQDKLSRQSLRPDSLANDDQNIATAVDRDS